MFRIIPFVFCVFFNIALMASEDLVGSEHQKEKLGLPVKAFELLREQVKEKPSVITTNQTLLREISSEQLKVLIKDMELSHHSFLYPVRIKGEKLTSMLGRDFRKLSIMSVWDGKLIPIPFQFDEYDRKSSYIYIENINPFPIQGTQYLIDGKDELVFHVS